MDKLPPSMELLKDWSIWMVGLETGILGLVTFIGGKEGFFKLNGGWARVAIFSFRRLNILRHLGAGRVA